MEITGKIFTINNLSEKLSQVVIKKQVAGQKVLIAVDVYGFWKDKMDAMKLQKNEKITGKIYMKSKLYKGKYYTDVLFKEINRYIGNSKYGFINKKDFSQKATLFKDYDIPYMQIVDEETGEIRL